MFLLNNLKTTTPTSEAAAGVRRVARTCGPLGSGASMGAMREVKYASVGEQRRFNPSCKYSTEATLVDMVQQKVTGHRKCTVLKLG